MTILPELEIKVVITDDYCRNPPRTVYKDTLSPKALARLIGDYAYAIYAMPDEVTATVACTHKDRRRTAA